MYEQLCLDAFRPEYNLLPTAGSALGYRHSDATKALMRMRSTGKTHSAEAKKKMSEARIGNTNCVGRVASAETKLKIAEANRGRVTSEETKMKLRIALKGKTRQTPEGRKRISDAQKLRWMTHRERSVYKCPEAQP